MISENGEKMLKNIRIIPKLEIKGPNLVKGIHLEGLRVLGKPENFARYYYESGADELIYMDVVASLYNRNSLHEIIERTAKEIFIPLVVGGGLRTIEDIRAVLRVGADKVALNTAAIKNPGIIKEAANRFGSSTIIVSIEVIKQSDGTYLVYTDNGREYTGLDVRKWAIKAAEFGAGEILLTSVDREGAGIGYDIELTKMVSDAVSIPVITCGGAGKVEDIKKVILDGNADAVCVASMLHYGLIKKQVFEGESYIEEGNIEYLKSGNNFSKIETADISEIKSYLTMNGIGCRYTEKKELLNAR